MTWNERLKKARQAMLPPMGKSAFARAVGVSPATVTNWENGKVETLRAENLMQICRTLGVSESWLMDGDSTETSTAETTRKLTLVLDLRCETAAELRLLTAHRLATPREQIALNHAADTILERLPGSGGNQAQPGRGGPG